MNCQWISISRSGLKNGFKNNAKCIKKICKQAYNHAFDGKINFIRYLAQISLSFHWFHALDSHLEDINKHLETSFSAFKDIFVYSHNKQLWIHLMSNVKFGSWNKTGWEALLSATYNYQKTDALIITIKIQLLLFWRTVFANCVVTSNLLLRCEYTTIMCNYD